MAVEYNPRYLKYFFEPVAETYEEGFWDAIRERKLKFQRCKECGTWLHPPRPICYKCKSYDLEWVESSGKAKIHSWVVFNREVSPAFRVPYEVILVDMVDEKGVRMTSNMVDCEPEDLYFDMPVEVVFYDVTEEITLPLFKKAES